MSTTACSIPLVASFSNVNSEIIVFSLILLAAVIFALRKELALLDVLTLGKEQAINLGVDYDRCIRRLLLGVTLCIAVATAMVGPISFWGSSLPTCPVSCSRPSGTPSWCWARPCSA